MYLNLRQSAKISNDCCEKARSDKVSKRKDRCKSMAASSFVDGVTFFVFALRNSACTSQRVFPRLYSDWGLATPESTHKKFLVKENFSKKGKNQALTTLIRFHKSHQRFRSVFNDPH